MTTPHAASRAAPVAQDGRIDAIDVLRGFALLGILVMNIQLFAMPDAAYLNPMAYGDLDGANYAVWLGSRLFADQKFMTIFSMLFGAGIVLMTGRAEARGTGRTVHYRRMGWLLVIGLVHAHLIWSGDILFLYGVCGMLVYSLRNGPPRRLLLLGFATLAVSSVLYLLIGWSMPFWGAEAVAEFSNQSWQPPQAAIEAQLAAYRGSWLDQQPVRSASAIGFETLVLLVWGVWRAGGLMLIGMALFKLDVFSARRSRAFYGALVAVAVLVAIPVESYGVYLDFESDWAVTWSFFQGDLFNYWPSIGTSLGYVGLVMLVCQTPALRAVTRPFAAVGQMALTNYLLHSVICTTIFYGHGLGYYGAVDRLGQLGVVAGVWAVQLIVSPLWLRRFRYGPAEWLWRSLTYRVRPPFLRAPSPAHSPAI